MTTQPTPAHQFQIGDIVIIKATGEDGRVEHVETGRNGKTYVYVHMTIGEFASKLIDYQTEELEFWSIGVTPRNPDFFLCKDLNL